MAGKDGAGSLKAGAGADKSKSTSDAKPSRESKVDTKPPVEKSGSKSETRDKPGRGSEGVDKGSGAPKNASEKPRITEGSRSDKPRTGDSKRSSEARTGQEGKGGSAAKPGVKDAHPGSKPAERGPAAARPQNNPGPDKANRAVPVSVKQKQTGGKEKTLSAILSKGNIGAPDRKAQATRAVEAKLAAHGIKAAVSYDRVPDQKGTYKETIRIKVGNEVLAFTRFADQKNKTISIMGKDTDLSTGQSIGSGSEAKGFGVGEQSHEVEQPNPDRGILVATPQGEIKVPVVRVERGPQTPRVSKANVDKAEHSAHSKSPSQSGQDPRSWDRPDRQPLGRAASTKTVESQSQKVAPLGPFGLPPAPTPIPRAPTIPNEFWNGVGEFFTGGGSAKNVNLSAAARGLTTGDVKVKVDGKRVTLSKTIAQGKGPGSYLVNTIGSVNLGGPVGTTNVRVGGALTVETDGHWTFEGLVQSVNGTDRFDFDPQPFSATHRTGLGEVLTEIGSGLVKMNVGDEFDTGVFGRAPITGTGAPAP